MEIINTILGVPLGYLMYFCYLLVGNYGVSIMLFTLLTKVVMFPLSIMSQKNSITMVKMHPLLEDIKQRYAGNNTLIIEEQKALYKREHYSTIKGMIPLLVQIPIILGLINVVYNPLQHLLHMDPQTIGVLLTQASQVLGTPLGDGLGAQLSVMEAVQAHPEAFFGIAGADQILSVDLHFFGLSMTELPSLASLTILYPILSGASALALSMYQNKFNVLQQSQSGFSKWGVTVFLIVFSAYFAYVLPCGIGLYWITGNLLSIPVLYICNKIYDPKRFIDYENRSEKPKRSKEEKAYERAQKKEKHAREKADKKRFFAYPNKQLVFYSESSGFYKYFENLIEYIIKHSDIVIHYVTSDYNDQIFKNQNPRIQTYYIGPIALIQFMMLMDADMVVMTMPDLEQYHIKRSLVRNDVEYVYLDHGMTSFHLMLRKGALDHYDTIFCYGPNHIDEIRETERVYGLAPKRLVKTGYGLLDTLLKSVEAYGDAVNDPKTILIGPSWQNDNIMEYCLEETLRPLLGMGYKIILRPHPEFVKRFPSKMKAILERYQNELKENFVIETDFSSNKSVYTADLVITDWSSIAQEFSYATKKPSIFINTPMKVMNPEYEKIPLVPLDISLRDEIGVSVDVDQLPRLPEIVDELFSKSEYYREKITRVLQQNIYDIGRGVQAGGDYIIDTLTKVQQLRSQKAAQQSGAAEEMVEASSPPCDELYALAEKFVDNPADHEAVECVLNRAVSLENGSLTNREYIAELLQEVEQLQSRRGATTDEK